MNKITPKNRHLQKSYFITGTDTDVGKTVIACGLGLALSRLGIRVHIVKPVQTGCAQNGLAPDVGTYRKHGLSGKAICSLRLPSSPHLAAMREGQTILVDELAVKMRAEIFEDGVTLFEGAGGIYVPLNEKEYMLDLMAAAALPILLIVNNRLGCLNHALLSLDALEKSGLTVAGIILCRATSPDKHDPGTTPEAEKSILADNAARLEAEACSRGISLLADIPWDQHLAEGSSLAMNNLAELLTPAARRLLATDNEIAAQDIEKLLEFDRRHLWHPYTSALKPLETQLVSDAHACTIRLADGRKLTDGMSSWWCAVNGYANRNIVNSMQRQCAKLSHIMFGGLTHEPAVRLGEKLLNLLPDGLEHIFYADSGSVAVEVAMKMALQYAKATGHEGRTRFLALRHAYHGDTLGAMSLCDPVTGMHSLFSGTLPRQIFVEQPACRFPGSSLMHGKETIWPQDFILPDSWDDSSFAPMSRSLHEHAAELAAVVVEPVVQGAGGMWFYHPAYLKKLRELCAELDILLVADEIATGFGRTGRIFACEWAGISPDILCCGKALTGGMMTFSAVAASRRVAYGISSANASCGGGVFMHGPTYMGNPLACATACASLAELLKTDWQNRVARIEKLMLKYLAPCCGKEGVADVRVLGAIGVVEMNQPVDVGLWQKFFIERGVWIRPFGKTVYIMPPLIASENEVASLCSAICAAVKQFGK